MYTLYVKYEGKTVCSNDFSNGAIVKCGEDILLMTVGRWVNLSNPDKLIPLEWTGWVTPLPSGTTITLIPQDIYE